MLRWSSEQPRLVQASYKRMCFTHRHRVPSFQLLINIDARCHYEFAAQTCRLHDPDSFSLQWAARAFRLGFTRRCARRAGVSASSATGLLHPYV